MCRDTDIVFFGAHQDSNDQLLTINRLYMELPFQSLPTNYLQFKDIRDFWFGREKFAKETTCQVGWYRMKKNLIPESLGQPFYKRGWHLQPNETVGKAVVYTYGAFLHLLATGEYLYQLQREGFIWCEDFFSNGRVVTAGFVDDGIWQIEPANIHSRLDFFGLAPLVLPQY